jgi:hypothetical protein
MIDQEKTKQFAEEMDERRREWAQEVEAGMKENDPRCVEYWEAME